MAASSATSAAALEASSSSSSSSSSSAPPGWSRVELAHALRSAAPSLRTPYGAGRLVALRATSPESAVVQLSFGTAFLAVSRAALGPPPARFAPGTRVDTAPFGKGVVERCRVSAERIDYEVRLVECRLSEGREAVAFLQPERVAGPRVALLFAEASADAAGARARGNELFRAKDFYGAAAAYGRATEVIGEAAVDLSESQKDTLRDEVSKALANTAQCFLSRAAPDNARAAAACRDALAIAASVRGAPHASAAEAEAHKVALQAFSSKVRYRLGVALMGLSEWKLAIAELSHPVHTEGIPGSPRPARVDPVIGTKLTEARKRLAEQQAHDKKRWAYALSHLSDDAAGGGADAGAGTGTGAGAGATAAGSASPTTKKLDMSSPLGSAAAAGAASAPRPSASAGAASPLGAGGLAPFFGASPTPASPLRRAGSSPAPAAAAAAASPLQEPSGAAKPPRLSMGQLKDSVAAAQARTAPVRGGGAGGDATAEQEQEQEPEEATSWGTYALYGGLAVGALAIGALAISALRRGGGGSGAGGAAAAAAKVVATRK